MEESFVENERTDLSELSAILYANETWCLREYEMAILNRTEKAMTTAKCEVELIEKRSSQNLGLEKTSDRQAKANGIRW